MLTLQWKNQDGTQTESFEDSGLALEEMHLLVKNGVRGVKLTAVFDGLRYQYMQRTGSQWGWIRDYTVAELRDMARDKEAACDFGQAAILYRIAVATYPADPMVSQLARADIAYLCEAGNTCAQMAYREAHRDYRAGSKENPQVMTMHPLTGVTVLIGMEDHMHHGCVHPEQMTA